MVTKRDMIAYTIGLFVGAFMMFYAEPSNAGEINIYQAESDIDDSVIEYIDDCGESHRLVLPTKYLTNTRLIDDWMDKVIDKCK